MEKLKEDFDRVFPKSRMVEFQTWPFDQERPESNWVSGKCELHDLMWRVKIAMFEMGLQLYWRDIENGM